VLGYPDFCRGVFSILRTHRQKQKHEQQQRYGKPPYKVRNSLLTFLHMLLCLYHCMCSFAFL
jgi:hypothetical protein